MFLGHDWNILPTTTVYDDLGFDGYAPTGRCVGEQLTVQA
jgi:hypothetical protein